MSELVESADAPSVGQCVCGYEVTAPAEVLERICLRCGRLVPLSRAPVLDAAADDG